ncbi:MAG: DUF4340 domain-containing protein [Candidatus Hydrogenedentota bacterium]
MNAKVLIPLALLLIVLVGAVVIKQRSQEETSIVDQAQLENLAPEDLEAAGINRIELYNGTAQDEAVVLERESVTAPWKVASHFDAPAKAADVDDFLATVFDLRGDLREEPASEARLGRYGLEADKAMHVALYKSGAEEPAFHLLVGDNAGTSTLFLRRANERRVFDDQTDLRRAAGIFGEGQAPEADNWLDKNVIALEEDAEITGVDLTLPDKRLVLARVAEESEAEEDGQEEDAADATPSQPATYTWEVTEGGPGLPLKEETWTSRLARLRNLSATDIVDPAETAEYGLDDPAYRCVLNMDGQEDVTMEGSRPKAGGDGYLRLADAENDIVYKLSSYNFEQVFPKTGTLFDLPKFAEDAEADQIGRVEIAYEGREPIVLEQGDDAWDVAAPATELGIQENTVQQVADTLAGLAPSDYADSDVDAGPWNWTITATIDGQREVLRAGGDAKSIDGVYVRLGDDDRIYAISRTDANKLLLDVPDVLQMQVLDVTPTDSTAVSLHLPGGEGRLEKQDGAWKLAKNGGFVNVDQAAARDFVTEVVTLEAQNVRMDAAPDMAAEAETGYTVTMQDGEEHAVHVVADPTRQNKWLLFKDGLGHGLSVDKRTLDTLSEAFTRVTESQVDPAEAEPVPPEQAETAEQDAGDTQEEAATVVVTPGEEAAEPSETESEDAADADSAARTVPDEIRELINADAEETEESAEETEESAEETEESAEETEESAEEEAPAAP